MKGRVTKTRRWCEGEAEGDEKERRGKKQRHRAFKTYTHLVLGRPNTTHCLKAFLGSSLILEELSAFYLGSEDPALSPSSLTSHDVSYKSTSHVRSSNCLSLIKKKKKLTWGKVNLALRFRVLNLRFRFMTNKMGISVLSHVQLGGFD